VLNVLDMKKNNWINSCQLKYSEHFQKNTNLKGNKTKKQRQNIVWRIGTVAAASLGTWCQIFGSIFFFYIFF